MSFLSDPQFDGTSTLFDGFLACYLDQNPVPVLDGGPSTDLSQSYLTMHFKSTVIKPKKIHSYFYHKDLSSKIIKQLVFPEAESRLHKLKFSPERYVSCCVRNIIGEFWVYTFRTPLPSLPTMIISLSFVTHNFSMAFYFSLLDSLFHSLQFSLEGQDMSPFSSFNPISTLDAELKFSIPMLLEKYSYPKPGESISLSLRGLTHESFAVVHRPLEHLGISLDLTPISILQNLTPQDFLSIDTALLMGQSVCVVGESLREISILCVLLRYMLYPFKWSTVFFPTFPVVQLLNLEAPSPMVVGLLRQDFKGSEEYLGRFIVIDMLERCVYYPHNTEELEDIMILPNAHQLFHNAPSIPPPSNRFSSTHLHLPVKFFQTTAPAVLRPQFHPFYNMALVKIKELSTLPPPSSDTLSPLGNKSGSNIFLRLLYIMCVYHAGLIMEWRYACRGAVLDIDALISLTEKTITDDVLCHAAGKDDVVHFSTLDIGTAVNPLDIVELTRKFYQVLFDSASVHDLCFDCIQLQKVGERTFSFPMGEILEGKLSDSQLSKSTVLKEKVRRHTELEDALDLEPSASPPQKNPHAVSPQQRVFLACVNKLIDRIQVCLNEASLLDASPKLNPFEMRAFDNWLQLTLQ
ncbi:hypothetical protein BLNAU_385 [Blattamonas nauphoetae]|uniref:cDENN domain-containing protein n=1 Tax=Blattamonas nauphoetae TaxID=2049346 RepID=A0ABQ9YL38_9EUKA|nr:hypothetical protein BLNAU_385 [Blattamonas nauphoetae]